jgi:hypothetical protein
MHVPGHQPPASALQEAAVVSQWKKHLRDRKTQRVIKSTPRAKRSKPCAISKKPGATTTARCSKSRRNNKTHRFGRRARNKRTHTVAIEKTQRDGKKIITIRTN